MIPWTVRKLWNLSPKTRGKKKMENAKHKTLDADNSYPKAHKVPFLSKNLSQVLMPNTMVIELIENWELEYEIWDWGLSDENWDMKADI